MKKDTFILRVVSRKYSCRLFCSIPVCKRFRPPLRSPVGKLTVWISHKRCLCHIFYWRHRVRLNYNSKVAHGKPEQRAEAIKLHSAAGSGDNCGFITTTNIPHTRQSHVIHCCCEILTTAKDSSHLPWQLVTFRIYSFIYAPSSFLEMLRSGYYKGRWRRKGRDGFLSYCVSQTY